MDTYNTTWISTVSGTGTTWTFNIVKEIFKYSNLNVLPEKVYKYHKKYLGIYKDNALKDNDVRNHYVLQCHAILSVPLIKSRWPSVNKNIINNISVQDIQSKCLVEHISNILPNYQLNNSNEL